MNFDPNKPVCTRDGRKATIISDDNDICVGFFRYPIYAEIQHPNQSSIVVGLRYMKNGQLKSGTNFTCHDLINQEIWHEWLNQIYWESLMRTHTSKLIKRHGDGNS